MTWASSTCFSILSQKIALIRYELLQTILNLHWFFALALVISFQYTHGHYTGCTMFVNCNKRRPNKFTVSEYADQCTLPTPISECLPKRPIFTTLILEDRWVIVCRLDLLNHSSRGGCWCNKCVGSSGRGLDRCKSRYNITKWAYRLISAKEWENVLEQTRSRSVCIKIFVERNKTFSKRQIMAYIQTRVRGLSQQHLAAECSMLTRTVR